MGLGVRRRPTVARCCARGLTTINGMMGRVRDLPCPMKAKLANLAQGVDGVWRLASPYFRSNHQVKVEFGPFGTGTLCEKWIALVLLCTVVCIEIGLVGIFVLLNHWNASFFDAIQDKNIAEFWKQLAIFALISAVFISTSVYQLYLNQWLHIRWRVWMTHHYLDRWLEHCVHYRMRLTGDPTDNPDQRIAEDIELFVDRTLSLAIGLLSAGMMLGSFIVILWGLSRNIAIPVGVNMLTVPGSLVWIAVGFALIGTFAAHIIGRPLVDLNFLKQRYEADFRFALVRLRENSEEIALMRGEAIERGVLARRFAKIELNWYATMARTKKLTFFTSGYNHIAIVLPTIAAAPQYFAGALSLGTLTQTGGAFGQVQTALSFFVTAYPRLAEWKAVVDRLVSFEARSARAIEVSSERFGVSRSYKADTVLTVEDVALRLPDGTLLVEGVNFAARRNQALLLMGPSGCGKSTLLRAVGGLWPYVRGCITLARGSRVLIISQNIYFPLGSLASALAYPARSIELERRDMRQALIRVGLAAFAPRMHQIAQWSERLSVGEKQRFAFARALLARPDVLLIDEATSALDDATEAFLYCMLRTELSRTAIISIGHRTTLQRWHDAKVCCNWLYRSGAEKVVADAQREWGSEVKGRHVLSP
jgi:putative ATP-binding cassette transporter